ncbi:hypothetical protein EVAR_90301_1 [Eumeta japonica]|uniref:beta-glucosidase n=1 Tax=Eumeta variegata TaxID=151549 RepID=A0A4C2AEH8_EUMVA|nr:hypothetical protein EVAR_90301_1 [Eumeta japonica]
MAITILPSVRNPTKNRFTSEIRFDHATNATLAAIPAITAITRAIKTDLNSQRQMSSGCHAVWYAVATVAKRDKYVSEDQVHEDVFPSNFMFGVATAYQIEGAWNISGVQFYRFSISWPEFCRTDCAATSARPSRVLQAYTAQTKRKGYQTYGHVIPLGSTPGTAGSRGWTNTVIADYFVDAQPSSNNYFLNMLVIVPPILKLHFWRPRKERSGCGSRSTNPTASVTAATAAWRRRPRGQRAGGLPVRAQRAQGARHGLQAGKTNGGTQKGIVGLTLEFNWYEPADNDSRNGDAAERARQFNFGLYAHPIFSKTGDYPSVMRQRIDANSALQNYSRSRLPTFTNEELTALKGSADFLGFNHYTTILVREDDGKVSPKPSFDNDVGVAESRDPSWPGTNSSWIKVVPWGFRKALNYVRESFDNPLILVTENGVSTTPGLKDQARITYLEGYLRALLAAVRDGCDIRAYTYWSLIDNFEWLNGYTSVSGLFEVDYDSVNKTRTARDSAQYYKQIINTGRVPPRPDYYNYTS